MISQIEVDSGHKDSDSEVIGRVFLSGPESSLYHQRTTFTLHTHPSAPQSKRQDILDELLWFSDRRKEGKQTVVKMYRVQGLPRSPSPQKQRMSTAEGVKGQSIYRHSQHETLEKPDKQFNSLKGAYYVRQKETKVQKVGGENTFFHGQKALWLDNLSQEQLLKRLSERGQDLERQIYFSLRDDSAPFLERFKTFSWETRKSIYCVFKAYSYHKEECLRDWFRSMLSKFQRANTFDIIKVDDKVPSPTEIFDEIINKTTISLSHEQFWKAYYRDWHKMLYYFQTLENRSQRKMIIEYFKKGSREEALYSVISNWYKYTTEDLQGVRFTEKPEFSKAELVARNEKLEAQMLKRLEMKLLELRPLFTAKQYVEFCREYSSQTRNIHELFRSFAISNQRRILRFFEGALVDSVKKQMTPLYFQWFKKVAKELEEEKKTYLNPLNYPLECKLRCLAFFGRFRTATITDPEETDPISSKIKKKKLSINDSKDDPKQKFPLIPKENQQ